jgi:endonuclease G
VVKGGTIEDNQLREIIKGQLRVPKYFFVALLMKNGQGYKACGFWLEHDGKDHGSEPIGNFAVNIRDLEQKTGIDFFCNLPDEVEDHVETLPIANVKRAWGL